MKKAITYNNLRQLISLYDRGQITLSYFQEKLNQYALDHYRDSLNAGLYAMLILHPEDGDWSEDMDLIEELLKQG